MTGRRPVLWCAILLALGGCTPGEDTDTSGDDTGDDTGPIPVPWNLEQIADHSGGLQTRLVLGPGGTPFAAYFSNEPYQDGVCDEVPVSPPPRMRHTLYLAERTGDDTWSVDPVDTPVVAFTPTGLSLAIDDLDRPAVAYTGGEPQMQYCGANDAVLAVRDGEDWSFDTASAESGDSGTGLPASDAGFVVGLWPGLAYDADGDPAMLHRDAHFGSLQHDDLYRADAEFAWRDGNAWDHEAVDPGEGAGDYGTLLFDTSGRPVAVYAITVEAQSESRLGVWAARRDPSGTWERVRLHDGAIHHEIAAAVDPDTQDMVVAFYSAFDQAVRVRRLADPTQFTDPGAWASEFVGKAQYDEGQHVSLAFAPDGRTALAYHRCKRVTSTAEGCDQNDEAVVIAVQEESGWDYEVVHEGTVGSCGEYTSLAIEDDDTAWVAFRCTQQVDSEFVFRPMVAWRTL